MNIITNHIDRCKKIEEYLYNEFGIMLNITNNKKLSLLKSELIINIDFPKELINQYKIYNKAIIINLLNKIPIKSKKFNGININYYKINMPNKYIIDGFENEIIYEAKLLKYKEFEYIRKRITKDKIKIKKLIGNNGFIEEKEIV